MNRISLFVLVFLSSLNVVAQKDIENKLKLDLWTNATPEFKAMEVPEKWKNESAVVLAWSREYSGDYVTKMGLTPYKVYAEKLTFHYRIKVLDKAAVSDFSNLSFNDKTVRNNLFGRAAEYNIIAAKIVKPDGSEKEVDLSTAVKTDVTSENELKIPLPNLEPGDIIDYYIAIKSESAAMSEFGDEVTLEAKYPIASNYISFTVPVQFNFVHKSFNGAPEFKEETVKKDHVYTLHHKMQEKEPDIIWTYEYRTAPHVRYRVTTDFSANSRVLAEKSLASFSSASNAMDVGVLEDFINLNFKKEKNNQKIIQEMYYALRNPIYKNAYFQIEQGDPLGDDYTPNKFFLIVDKFLTRRKIPHEVLLVPARSFGPMEDVVNFSSCDLIIRVNTTPPVYISRPGAFTMLNQVPRLLEGMEGVSDEKLSTKPIPVSTSEQNKSQTTFAVNLVPDDFTKLKVKRNVKASGYIKIEHQYMVCTNYDYLREYDQQKYMAESSRLMGGLVKNYQKEKLKFEQRRTQDYNERDERIKDDIERSIGCKPIDYSLTLKTIGMWEDEPDTEYEENFTLENFGKKAGPNYIIDLGKLIEKQTEITDRQKSRTRDVYMDFARSFNHEIMFTIPDGFVVEGIEALNKKTENEDGGFTSTAVLSGNTLLVKSKKYYSRHYYAAGEWPKITAFLTTAAEFYNTKILLKKQ